MKFVMVAGHAKHLGASLVCKCWWEAYLDSLRTCIHGMTPDDSLSSEVASDKDRICPLDSCNEDIPVKLDWQELGDPSWHENHGPEETGLPQFEDLEFTSTPFGIDLHSVELINAADLPVTVEEYPV